MSWTLSWVSGREGHLTVQGYELHRADAFTEAPYAPFRARSEHLTGLSGLVPERQGQNVALTVLFVPYLLDSGRRVSWHYSFFSHRLFSEEDTFPLTGLGTRKPLDPGFLVQGYLAHKKQPPPSQTTIGR